MATRSLDSLEEVAHGARIKVLIEDLQTYAFSYSGCANRWPRLRLQVRTDLLGIFCPSCRNARFLSRLLARNQAHPALSSMGRIWLRSGPRPTLKTF